ncbi:MAG: oxidoreductase [Hydrogenobacter sp.]
MFEILAKEFLCENTLYLRVRAPHISHAKPGQFVLLQLKEYSERVPICVFETFEDGFSCIIDVVGKSTLEIKEEGERFYYISGPLGRPFPIYKYGKVLIYSKNWGISPAVSVGRALKNSGNYIKLVYFDGSFTTLLQKENFDEVILEREIKKYDEIDLVISTGENRLSKAVAQMYSSIRHIAMPNVHILCATGLCLSCRLRVKDSYVLACTEGPWFDAKEIMWDDVIRREDIYREEESVAFEEYKKALARRKLREEVIHGKDVDHYQT